MSSMLAREVLTALSEFSSHTRLYELTLRDSKVEPDGRSLLPPMSNCKASAIAT